MRLGSAVIAITLAAGLSACSQPPTPSAPPSPELTTEQKQAALASLPAPYNTADLKNGEAKFALCRSCHTVVSGGPNLTGPNLYGVFGRHAGSKEGFAYSDALKAAGFAWDAPHLDAWLADPRGYMPGTKMTFPGLKDEKDRIDLIAFLKIESGYKP